MKKVLAAAALLCAVSSFAAWDKFQVVGYGKGEARVGMVQGRQGTGGGDDDTFKDAYVGMRYSPLENLELTFGSSLGDNYTVGARYQVISMLGVGVDIGTPIVEPVWTIHPSVQFAMDIVPDMLSLGSNVGLAIYTENKYDNKYAQGMDLDAGVEFDFVMGKSIIFAGVDIGTGITRSKNDGKPDDGIPLKDDNDGKGRGMEITPSVGYIANVGDNLSLLTFAAFDFGKDAGHFTLNDKGEKEGIPNTTVGVEFTVKF